MSLLHSLPSDVSLHFEQALNSGVQVRQVFGMSSGDHGLQHGQATLDLFSSKH